MTTFMERSLIILCAAVLLSAAWSPWVAVAAEKQRSVFLYMEDGQLISRTIRVQVNREIYESMKPKLTLHFNASLGKEKIGELIFTPMEVIPKQMLHDKDGKEYEGSLLLFKLKNKDNKTIPFNFYETGIRVKPVLSWCSNRSGVCSAQERLKVASENEVYIGNLTHAVVMAMLSIIIFIVALGGVLRFFKNFKKKGHKKKASFWGGLLSLLCDGSGELSLSRSQMALWTLAIGGVVLIFGLTRLEVPVIPEQLVALMGLSISTTIASGVLSSPSKKRNNQKPELLDLLTVQTETNNKRFANTSLAKAQLIFWTLITLALFCLKSLIEGELWEVPWELVVLMGMSQTGYLARHTINNHEKQTGGQEK